MHYVEKPETYVSDTINAGAYLFSSEIFKHMAQVFEEQYNNELVIDFNWLLYVYCVPQLFDGENVGRFDTKSVSSNTYRWP